MCAVFEQRFLVSGFLIGDCGFSLVHYSFTFSSAFCGFKLRGLLYSGFWQVVFGLVVFNDDE